jgi:hypothetical protein
MKAAHLAQTRSDFGAIERFFEWSESTLCPHPDVTKDSVPPEETALDYVFEHIESFACRDEIPKEEETTQNPSLTLARENSLVEYAKGRPNALKNERQQVNKFGEDGDLLDYCFEHVESYACGQAATGDLDLSGKSSTRRASTGKDRNREKTRMVPGCDSEDAIQLYFRPEQRRFSCSSQDSSV